MRILHWFRKDLRLDDNTALSEAAHDARHDVVPFYASDPDWFAAPRHRADARALRARRAHRAVGGASPRAARRLALAHGDPAEVVTRAARAAKR